MYDLMHESQKLRPHGLVEWILPYLVHMENQVKLTDILKAFVQSFHKNLWKRDPDKTAEIMPLSPVPQGRRGGGVTLDNVTCCTHPVEFPTGTTQAFTIFGHCPTQHPTVCCKSCIFDWKKSLLSRKYLWQIPVTKQHLNSIAINILKSNGRPFG